MSVQNARHSAADPDWFTPDGFVEAARTLMGAIDLDPASEPAANERIKATKFFTAEENGLLQWWSGRIFLNPPGGQVNEFWLALMNAYLRGTVAEAIWIGFSLEQLQTLQVGIRKLTDGPADRELPPHPLHFPTCYPSRRIAFLENEAKRAARLAKGDERKKVSPTHANYVTYIGPQIRWFKEIFSQFGEVVIPRSF